VIFLFGAFLIAHGLVFAMYAAHAMRLFEVKPGLTWPDASWALSGLIGDPAVRSIVVGAFLLVAVGFAVSGVALMLRQTWWQWLAAAMAILSTVVILLVWNGRMQELSEQGLIAVIINVVVVVTALVLHWPMP
jgi:hypothetical protein